MWNYQLSIFKNVKVRLAQHGSHKSGEGVAEAIGSHVIPGDEVHEEASGQGIKGIAVAAAVGTV